MDDASVVGWVWKEESMIGISVLCVALWEEGEFGGSDQHHPLRLLIRLTALSTLGRRTPGFRVQSKRVPSHASIYIDQCFLWTFVQIY